MPKPAYSLQIRQLSSGPAYTVMFRWGGKQVKRHLGPAWADDDGQPRRGRPPAGVLEQAAAHDAARAVLDDHVASAEATASGPTFRQLAHAYLDWLESVRKAKPSTVYDHRATLGEPGQPLARGRRKTTGHIMAAIGNLPADDVTPADVESILRTVAATGAAPRTVNKYLFVVSAVYTHALKPTSGFDLTNPNPAKACQPRKLAQPASLQTYTVDEVEKLAEAFADEQDRELVRVAAYLGLRLGELRALRWSDVHDEENTVTVQRALSHGVEGPAAGNQLRRIPLTYRPKAALERLRERGQFTGAEDLVFPNAHGEPIDESALRRRHRAGQERAGLRRIRVHDLRHTYGSLLAAHGQPAIEIQACMGHQDPKTTQRYLHAREASEMVSDQAGAFD